MFLYHAKFYNKENVFFKVKNSWANVNSTNLHVIVDLHQRRECGITGYTVLINLQKIRDMKLGVNYNTTLKCLHVNQHCFLNRGYICD